MATLSFKSINKIYPNHVQAVFDFNLDVKDKEFIVFVGPSGCGKSTTLRMIAGLEEITYGQLYINGLEVNNVEPKDRNIAMVFQSYALYPHMTVFNNMAFSLKLRKVKMPVYEQNEEVVALRKENEELFKEIAKVNRIIRKKNEPKEALEERERILDQIFANEEKARSLSKQLTGISILEIETVSNAIKKIEKDIESSKATLAKCEKDIANVSAKLASEELTEEKREFYEKTLKSLEDIKRLTSEGLKQKEVQLEETTKQKEYYENNEVLLFESRKHTKYEIALEVYKTARILDLSRYLFRKPAALSGGQRQRVALGRAIVRNPQVFLMDEPLSNLDAKLRVQMRSEIIKIHEAVGATTIYVTHDQTEAMTMASRIVVMKDGYIQQIGTPKEVYNDPENLFVAGFIGSPSMNFFKGVVKGNKFYFDGENEVSLSLGKEHTALLKDYDGKAVTLGVRPESIFLKGNVNNSNPSDAYQTVCDFSELLGHELVIYTDINGQKLVFKTSTKDEVVSHDNIEICFNNDSLYFFDSESTKRIR